ncbi:hypothetical protein [Janthinobacterium sp. J1-1]|uniref:hypothetical protein n=1 Tax=unclassified Janthinobacterium TaxID=2610881 RepID=UPI0028110D33|nr:hypothetical protein [Janthinobacterium sp. J1-1]
MMTNRSCTAARLGQKSDGKNHIRPIADPDGLDARRASMGMRPFDDNPLMFK